MILKLLGSIVLVIWVIPILVLIIGAIYDLVKIHIIRDSDGYYHNDHFGCNH